jgi:hypothetical protein
LYFVLHHCADPEAVLQEALRTCRHVVIAESVYESRPQHALLRTLDPWANRLRSGGAMRSQEDDLAFRTAEAWKDLARRLGGSIRSARRRGPWWHRQLLLRVEK